MTKKNSKETCEDQSLPLADLVILSKRAFDLDTLRIGGQDIPPQMRELYRDQALNLLTTQLWEVIEATALNESARLALDGSLSWDHVQFAKALKYWHTIIAKMLIALAKK